MNGCVMRIERDSNGKAIVTWPEIDWLADGEVLRYREHWPQLRSLIGPKCRNIEQAMCRGVTGNHYQPGAWAVIVDEEGLYIDDRYTLTMRRPTDGAPLMGPMLVVSFARSYSHESAEEEENDEWGFATLTAESARDACRAFSNWGVMSSLPDRFKRDEAKPWNEASESERMRRAYKAFVDGAMALTTSELYATDEDAETTDCDWKGELEALAETLEGELACLK
jgi:hypothetical protein